MKKIKKSLILLIIFCFTLLAGLVAADNVYYFNNKEKVVENRENLKLHQIRTLGIMYWDNYIDITDKQLIEAGFAVDSTQIENDTINIKIRRNK
ncbi:MAG: hypothetical protein H6Q16_98 [Bacteroidetes bacterium]|nr:hypothetical protein [Bacteroidota bacterium]